MDNNNSPRNSGASGAAAIIVVGIFVICVIFLFAKGLFSSNSADAPSGLDTATINTDESEPSPAQTSGTVRADTSLPESSSADSQGQTTSESAADSLADQSLGVMYITEYAYLHTAPSNDAENIVCMSPGIEVTVLGYEDNGYVKITFMNIDGQLTGYIYRDYLSETQTVKPAWES